MIRIAIINSNTNICENVSEDSRPINQINVPGYILLNLETTETIKWNGGNVPSGTANQVDTIGLMFVYNNSGVLSQVLGQVGTFA